MTMAVPGNRVGSSSLSFKRL